MTAEFSHCAHSALPRLHSAAAWALGVVLGETITQATKLGLDPGARVVGHEDHSALIGAGLPQMLR
jgi:hypothetical protein